MATDIAARHSQPTVGSGRSVSPEDGRVSMKVLVVYYELDGARFQGKHVATIAKKLAS